MYYILSLFSILSPATEIYLGELVPPITSLKLHIGEPAPSDGAFLHPADWIALKTAMENNISVCEWAVIEAVSVCIAECNNRRSDDCVDMDLLRTTIQSYELVIADVENELTRTKKANTAYVWGMVGASSLAVISLLVWSIK